MWPWPQRSRHLIKLAIPEVAPLRLFVHHARDIYLSPQLAKDGLWEPWQTHLILHLVSSGQTAVDVGANIGYYSLILSRLVGPRGRVLAFEPEPSNFELLRRNIYLNRLDNVIAEPKAVAHRSFRANLYLSDRNRGDHRLFDDAGGGRSFCPVDAIPLDAHPALADGPVHFVKVDTQGMEPGVLDGMAGVIGANREVLSLLIEFSPGLLARSGFGVDGLLRRLNDLKAEVFWLGEGKQGFRLTPIAPKALRGIAATMERTAEEDCSRDILVCFNKEHGGVRRLLAASW
jgi:FkbM family methyltransferase